MFIPEKRLKEILNSIQNTRILVIGDVMLDRYFWGDSTRISPEAPVPVVKMHKSEVRIGGAANVADNLMVLGAEPELISVIGNDNDGREFLEHAEELGLNTDSIIIDDMRPTTCKTRVMARSQQVCRIDNEIGQDIEGPSLDILLDKLDNITGDVKAVIISDYGKGIITPKIVSHILDICCNIGVFISVDPKENHWDYYAGVNLIKPNHHEVARATHVKVNSRDSLEIAGWKLLEITNAKSALVTTGEKGMSLFIPGQSVKHFSTIAREVYDVTGAGDTVIALSTAALANGASYEEAAILANYAAGIVVGEVGTAAATPEEILARMKKEQE